ncbi:MAG: TonB-dependent receptor plug domain-containing protein [Planctomycetota bacterium]
MGANSYHCRLRSPWIFAGVVVAFVLGGGASARLPGQTGDVGEIDDLAITELSLEELMAIDVTSVEGTERSWFATPAAVHVIRGEDIQRSGILHLPEALRLSPGVHYGQISSSTFSIASRGFGGRFSSKLLVLQDGRVLYDPAFSGVYWDVQSPLLADLERIEVVRGPGATLWGANAVNGVINVTTRSARDTQGWLLTAGGGTYENGFGSARYGGRLGDRAWYRVWGKYFQRENSATTGDATLHDAWELAKGGVRLDGEWSDELEWSVQAEGYQTPRLDEELRIPVVAATPTTIDIQDSAEATGAHVLFKLSRAARSGIGWTLKGYYDRTERMAFGGTIVNRDTLDLDLRQSYSGWDGHELLWGASVRRTSDRGHTNGITSLAPRTRALDDLSGFIQDTWTLAADRWFLMVGTKVEHNDTTGFEAQPSGRLWWTPTPHTTVWTAVSRAVRVPSRADRDLALTLAFADTGILAGGAPSGTIIPLQLTGDDHLRSEAMLIAELGFRVRPWKDVTLDVAGFHSVYDPLITAPDGNIGAFTNRGRARSLGGEVAARWRATQALELSASMSLLHIDAQRIGGTLETFTPTHMAQLHAHYDCPSNLGLDLALYYADSSRGQDISSYVTGDLGLSWRPSPKLRISLWGKNLIDHRHREASDGFFQTRTALVERSAFIEVELNF